MNEQKLYAVKDDKGYYWEFKDLCGIDLGGFWELLDVSVPFTASEDDAKNTVKDHGGYVVELVEAPAKVVVSDEEAKILERVKSRNEYPAESIHRYVYDSHNFPEWDYDREIRLMRAYVNGWTVEKPKLWNVKVPHTNCGWYFKCEDDENENPPILDELGCDTAGDPKNWDDSSYFTAAEIEHYGLQDCEKTEVDQDAE